MVRFLWRRLGHSLLVLAGVTIIVFFLTHLTGDPVRLMVPLDATAEDVAKLRREFGFDQPLYVQFLRFARGAVTLDFGRSIRHGDKAMALVLERMPPTLQLTVAALSLAILVAIPLGVITATRRGFLTDSLGSIVGLLGQSTPVFWLGILLIIIFAVMLKWLPAGGRGDWKTLILPAVTLGMYSMASIMRLLRSAMLEVLAQDYIKTARSKGLAERRVIYRHALRNALLPVVTIVGLQLGALLSGAVITETIFNWYGVGRFTVQAIFNRDFPVVQAAVFFFASIIVAINLVTDLLYAALDPRVRME